VNGHIRQRGASAWELKYDIGADPITGKRRIRYQTVRGLKRDAQRRLRELLAAVDEGCHVDKSTLTVGEHVGNRIGQWIGSGRISAATGEHYCQLLEGCIRPHIGAIPVQRLSALDLETWHAKLRTNGRRKSGKGVSGSTIRNAHRILSTALAEGARHGLVVRNVAEIERAPRDKTEEIEILGRDQLLTVMARLEGHELNAAVTVAWNTGMRRGEQLALDWRDVDFDRGVIQVTKALEETRAHGVRVKAPKTASGRREISLPESALAALRNHRRKQLEQRIALGLGKMPEDALVFPAVAGGYQSPRSLSVRWRQAVKRLGLPAVGWHALRHTHASMLIDAGVDVVTVSKRLGHASPTITLSTYAHKFTKDDGKAAEAINAAMARAQQALAGLK
jgi:integrase